jgi:hypothetical protein
MELHGDESVLKSPRTAPEAGYDKDLIIQLRPGRKTHPPRRKISRIGLMDGYWVGT